MLEQIKSIERTSPIQSSGPVRGLSGMRDFDQLFGCTSYHDQQCEKLNRRHSEPLSHSPGPSHRRNDEMRSWFKTGGAPASSLAMRLIHSSVALTLTILLLGTPARTQCVPSSQGSANELARRVVTNELTFQDDRSNWMYRLEKEQYGKKQVEEIVETKEGSLSRLISINDLPLTATQQMEEDQRVRELMISRSAQQKLRRTLEAETLQGRRLFKMLPDAFMFSYAGVEGNLVKLSFRPNPGFHPPSLDARVFTIWKARCGSTANTRDWLRLMVILHRPLSSDSAYWDIWTREATLRLSRQKLPLAIGT